MDLKRIRTFVVVAEQGTVSKASLNLRITQPALSRQLSELQREFGLKLFDRVGRNLALTSEGEQLLGECRSLLGHVNALGDLARLVRDGNAGVLRVGAGSVGIEVAFAELLHQYGRDYPAVQIKLVEGVGSELLNRLAQGEIHLAVCLLRSVEADGRDFATRRLPPVQLLAACRPSFPLKAGRMIDVAQVAAHPLLSLDTGFSVRKTFDAACQVAGVTPDSLIESATPSNLLALAEAGHGVAIVSSLVQTHRYKLRLARISLDDKPLQEPLVIVWDQRRSIPQHTKAFCNLLAEHMEKVLPCAPRARKRQISRAKKYQK